MAACGYTPKPVTLPTSKVLRVGNSSSLGNTLKVKTVFNISLIHLLDTFKSLVMGI